MRQSTKFMVPMVRPDGNTHERERKIAHTLIAEIEPETNAT
jgi:hypothetical protein